VARYLVTGGAGFIGSHLVESLLKSGHTVRVLDDLSTGRAGNLDDASAWEAAGRASGVRYEFMEGDIRRPDDCRRAVDGMDVVFHQAALGSVPRSVIDPKTTDEVNSGGTLNILIAAREAGVRRVVAASSSSVYGDTPTLPKTEEMPPDPLSPYALAKLSAETYCRLFWRLYGFPTVALRYFNVFGPRQDPESQYAAVIPRFWTAVLSGGRPVIHGDGEQTRDFTYIDNVVRVNIQAASAPEAACGLAYNIACERRISLLELLAMMETLAGAKTQPVFEPARAGDVKHSLASIDRARRLLAYEPSVGVEEGLGRMLAHYRATGRL
jgi:nucleoside-diphosphate-sugar epimerase